MRLPLVLIKSINTNLVECFRWFANRLFVWSAKFVSHQYFSKQRHRAMAIIFANLKGRTRFLTTRFWGKDISALDKLIRVLHKIGPRIALGGNDKYLCGLYDTTIYQWVNRVGVCENYAFLLSYGQNGDRR